MKAIITKKVVDEETGEKHYYFRNIYGLTAEDIHKYYGTEELDYEPTGVDVFSTSDYAVGDYVEYKKVGKKEYTHEKIEPTEEDKHAEEMMEKYLDAAAKNGGQFFLEVLTCGREQLEYSSDFRNKHALSDEEIQKLVTDYVESIKTFGTIASQHSALKAFWVFLDKNNLFNNEPVDYLDMLGYLAVDPDVYPGDDMEWNNANKLCVPQECSRWISYDGALSRSYISRFDFAYPGNTFSVDLYDDYELEVEPYIPGSFAKGIEEKKNQRSL